jgi:putative oxidoreductase
VRRLYSTFAAGLPGTGLLLLRLVVGATLVAHAGAALQRDPALNLTGLASACMATSGVLLISGLWTAIAGTLAVVVQIWQLWTGAGDAWIALLVAAIGGALAMLGPGLWSVDARLFGWRRVAVSARPVPPRSPIAG